MPFDCYDTRLIREVAGDYGHRTRLTFEKRTLEGVTAFARLRRADATIELTVDLFEDDGEGNGYIEVVWQEGDLVAGRHHLEFDLRTASTEETSPIIGPVVVLVRPQL